jgi:hypothetical protein
MGNHGLSAKAEPEINLLSMPILHLYIFLTGRLGLVSLYQAPLQARPIKEKHKTVKRLN